MVRETRKADHSIRCPVASTKICTTLCDSCSIRRADAWTGPAAGQHPGRVHPARASRYRGWRTAKRDLGAMVSSHSRGVSEQHLRHETERDEPSKLRF